MKTLRKFSSKPESIPAVTAWYLSDLGEAKGKQELFTKQSQGRTGRVPRPGAGCVLAEKG